jgi:adenylate cyclase
MFLAPSAEAGCRIALSLAEAFRGGTERPEVRVGLDWGDVLPQGGDYFGPVVNLAARITSLSDPCVPLVSARLREAAGDIEGVTFLPREAQVAKGIDEPVDVFALAAP